MPFRLHPSGYCAYYNESGNENLKPGKSCIFCGRVAGHAHDCPDFITYPGDGRGVKQVAGSTSRGSLFNAVSVLWHKSRVKSFITFTLPSLRDGVYQRSPVCEHTGDLAVTKKFSKVLEAYKIRVKRTWGEKMSYVWVSEAQMQRQEKFGGCGDLHFHLVVNQDLKNNAGRFIDYDTFRWLQSLWCRHIGAEANNCVHVDNIPGELNSIPAYLSKYLGKGAQRRIISRRFAASRDLTNYKPVTLQDFPAVDLVRSVEKQAEGFKYVMHYFNTSQVLDTYGAHMEDESRFTNTTLGRASDLNAEQAAIRAENKRERIYWESVAKVLTSDRTQVDTTIRPIRVRKSTKKLLGLS